jgi:putative phosphoribosyl transferase
LVGVTRWVFQETKSRELSVGYFGSSTGAAAALVAAAELSDIVGAVVSRGGRPDLAGDALEEVKAPTLLIVGGEDRDVITSNQAAYTRLHCEKAMHIVAGASHLFEEPGTLEDVAEMAAEWFAQYLRQSVSS